MTSLFDVTMGGWKLRFCHRSVHFVGFRGEGKMTKNHYTSNIFDARSIAYSRSAALRGEGKMAKNHYTSNNFDARSDIYTASGGPRDRGKMSKNHYISNTF